MSVLHFIRRAHLYMGLFLLPWVVMFGVSSIPFNHASAQKPPSWTQVAERPFDAEVPEAGANLRPIGRQMMDAAGLNGGYFVNRASARQVNVNHPNFLGAMRIIYHADKGHLVIEQRGFTLSSFISSLHTRGGYDLDGFWDSVWAVFVDILSVGLILWMASGLYMWWHLPVTRRWGWTALTAGAVCFAVLMFSL